MTKNYEHFSTRTEQELFHEQETELLAGLWEAKLNATMSQENKLRYHHGAGWFTHGVDSGDEAGEFKPHSVTHELKWEHIVNQRIDKLPAYFNDMIEKMYEQHMRLVYQMINESTEKTGNIVSASQAGSTANAFLEMLRKIEFGVDRRGNVSLPQIHAGKEMCEKWIQELETQGSEFKDEVERLKAEKTEQALAREALRRSKFKRPEND